MSEVKDKVHSSLLAQALKYAERGIPVFPCWQKNKSPRVKKGFKAATTNPATIWKWWKKWPTAMIGVPTGRKSGFDVIDIDVKKDEYVNGFDFMPDWQKMSPVIVSTPRGGAHLYFKSKGKVRISTDRIAPGVDTRGEAGYIIMPPSRNSDGGEYRFVNADDFNDLPTFPEELLARLEPAHDGSAGDEPEADPELIASAIAVIPNDDLGWDDWKKFGLAIYRATSGTGFPIFDTWSQKSSKYDAANTQNEWEAMTRSPPTRIGAGTIFYHANLADAEWWRKGDKLVLDAKAPVVSALEFVNRQYSRDEVACLRYYRGMFYRWSADGSHYEECDQDHLRSRLYEFLHGAVGIDGKPFNPNASKVNQIWDALKAVVEVDAKRQAPFFIDDKDRTVGDAIACRNGLLDPVSRKLTPHSPDFFNINALPFDYDPNAPIYPELWMKFLRDLFPGGKGSDGQKARLCLQEIFGLMLTSDTSFQKIFMMIGPRRSGKGTIARILTQLLGKGNVASPTLNSLASHFGLAPLIDKRCAVIADARLGPQTNAHTVAERLLSISGEDALTIDRKYRDAWTGRLVVRFLILSNELPGITDASGALSSRYVLLTLENSFYGNEDRKLADKLTGELPGILNWSFQGLERLRKRGHFEMPQASHEVIRQLEDLASPVGAFLREWCQRKPTCRIQVHELYDAYTKWCEIEGHKAKANAWFGRDLRAAVPGLKARGQGHERFYDGIDLSEQGRDRYERYDRSTEKSRR